MATTVVGRVSNARDAEIVVQDLVSTCSCNRADISLITQKVPRTESGKAEFGTLKGIASGIVIGGIAGYVVVAASVPMPEVFAKVIAAGPIHSAITGGFIGSVAFGVIGALIGAATSGADTDGYPGLNHPGALIMVHARSDREAECVVNVMRQHPVMEITKRSSNGEKPAPSNRSTVADPLMRADPKLSAGYSPPMGSPGLRSNRLSEPFATALARDGATKVVSRAGWITRKYTAIYYGPERRIAANQSPYQGGERRQTA